MALKIVEEETTYGLTVQMPAGLTVQAYPVVGETQSIRLSSRVLSREEFIEATREFAASLV